jgi:hypothetical protein
MLTETNQVGYEGENTHPNMQGQSNEKFDEKGTTQKFKQRKGSYHSPDT